MYGGSGGGGEGSPRESSITPELRRMPFLSYGEYSNCSASLSPPLSSTWPSVEAPNRHLSANSSPTCHFGSRLKAWVHQHEPSPHLHLPPVDAHGERVPFLLLPSPQPPRRKESLSICEAHSSPMARIPG